MLSNWNVDVADQGSKRVPNWVAAFLAALDEMEETEETDDDANPDRPR